MDDGGGSFLKILIVCVYGKGICTHEYRCLRNLEEGSRSPGAGLTGPLQERLLSHLSSTKGRCVFLVELARAGWRGRLALRN
jgi:hypothetical protein